MISFWFEPRESIRFLFVQAAFIWGWLAFAGQRKPLPGKWPPHAGIISHEILPEKLRQMKLCEFFFFTPACGEDRWIFLTQLSCKQWEENKILVRRSIHGKHTSREMRFLARERARSSRGRTSRNKNSLVVSGEKWQRRNMNFTPLILKMGREGHFKFNQLPATEICLHVWRIAWKISKGACLLKFA